MKLTWPPLQCERVGFEPNQQGQAASHEQASSMTPEAFQEVLFSSPARARALLSRNRTANVSLAARMMSSSKLKRCHYISVHRLIRHSRQASAELGAPHFCHCLRP